MPQKSSIALFIAATSALSISSSVNSGENDMGGLKEWNTDMDVNADFILFIDFVNINPCIIFGKAKLFIRGFERIFFLIK